MMRDIRAHVGETAYRDDECLVDNRHKRDRCAHGALIPARLEVLDRIAALVPPLRIHHHRYVGVLAWTAASGQLGWRGRRSATGLYR